MKSSSIITMLIAGLLLNGCATASASKLRYKASVEGSCLSYKNSAAIVNDNKKKTSFMRQYEQCLDRSSQEAADRVNMCYTMYFVGGFLTFGILWLLSPICETAA